MPDFGQNVSGAEEQMCHLILLLPVLTLPVFWLWAAVYALPVYLVISGFSVWVYFYAAAVMRRRVVIGPEMLLHDQAEMVSEVADGLRILLHGELCHAESLDSLRRGDRVEVVGITGVTLRVKSVPDANSSTRAHP
ncbi:MAG: hypothetical protein KIS75_07495 [Chromatiales bacterium]|nr:hypothetical protein [Chromatiales bacterium]